MVDVDALTRWALAAQWVELHLVEVARIRATTAPCNWDTVIRRRFDRDDFTFGEDVTVSDQIA